MKRFKVLFFVFFILNSHNILADNNLSDRTDVKKFISTMQREHGFDPSFTKKVLNQAQLQPTIIESITRPYEKKDWDIYKNIFLTEQRIEEGQAFIAKNQSLLNKAKEKYGVSPYIIVSIIGVETLYGKHQGNYRVLDALTTLAFNYPPRSAFFTKELSQYLLLCREHGVAPTLYYGSYAGAMGKPQFMPSSYRNFATDFSGKFKKDLMNDDEAAIASIANYLKKHRWEKDKPVAIPALVSGLRYKHLNTEFKKANYTLKQLQAFGVKPKVPGIDKNQKVGFIQLKVASGYEYWITFPNFYVITRYNSSPQYALVVYLLSKELEKYKA